MGKNKHLTGAFLAFAIFSSLPLITQAQTYEGFTLHGDQQEQLKTPDLKVGQTVTGTLNISGNVNDAISFWVEAPNGEMIINVVNIKEKEFTFNASQDGVYRLNFKNTGEGFIFIDLIYSFSN